MAKKKDEKKEIDHAIAALKPFVAELQLLLMLPCCHVSGIHDPEHFRQKKYVCESQQSQALKKFCHTLGINPVTKCKDTCGWCQNGETKSEKEYRDLNRKGAGLNLFWPNEDLVETFELENSGWQAEPTAETAERIGTVLKRKPAYHDLNKDFQREWKKFLASEKRSDGKGRKEAFGRESEGSTVTAPLSEFRVRISGKKSEDYQPYELERLVIHALRHSKRIFGL